MNPPSQNPLHSTAILLAEARGGSEEARDALLKRYLPVLQRWAHGRLPGYARGQVDTQDLVQVTLLRAFTHMEGFEPQREGAFLAYLRRILLNALRDEIRRATRQPIHVELEETMADKVAAPEARAIAQERVERYEAALSTLPETQQEALILRLEMGFSYPEIATAVGSPSANAARMMVVRALERLTEVMDEPGA